MVSMTHLAILAGFQTFQLDLHSFYRVSDKGMLSYNYFVTGEEDKDNFSIPGTVSIGGRHSL
jgi:hypothetical protein